MCIRDRYSYLNGLKVGQINRVFNFNTGVYDNKYKNEYKYHASGELELSVKYDWDASMAAWVEDRRTATVFSDGLKRITTSTHMNKAGIEENYLKTEYFYDLNRRLSRYDIYQWAQEMWKNKKRHYSYYKCSPQLLDQSVSISQLGNTCNTILQLGSTEAGVSYQIRDNTTNQILEHASAANGGTLAINVGTQPSTTIFKVLAAESGTAPVLNGVDEYVDMRGIAPVMSQLTDFTMEFKTKIRPDYSPAKQGGILGVHTSLGDNIFVVFARGNAANGLSVFDAPSGSYAMHSKNVCDNRWHHVAYTKTGGIGKLYVDGELQGEHMASYTLSSTDLWSIGQEYDGSGTPSDFLDGAVDDLIIWNYAKDEALIKQEMYIKPDATDKRLKVWYDFEDGLGSLSITDRASDVVASMVTSDKYSVWQTGAGHFDSHCVLELSAKPLNDHSGYLDADGDGYTPCAGDCDDTDPALHPGAFDIPGDGVDQDCSGQDAVATFVEKVDEGLLKVYPNPAEHELVIELSELETPVEQAFIYDLTGKLVKEIMLGANVTRIDVTMLKKGFYILSLNICGEVHIVKFIKS
jgi:hypothetical protein